VPVRCINGCINRYAGRYYNASYRISYIPDTGANAFTRLNVSIKAYHMVVADRGLPRSVQGGVYNAS
jgi:hypothetical protein